MSIKDIIRAWKDSTYRESLSEEERKLLPNNPIGEVLSMEELRSISGGTRPPTACQTDGEEICSSWPTDRIGCPPPTFGSCVTPLCTIA